MADSNTQFTVILSDEPDADEIGAEPRAKFGLKGTNLDGGEQAEHLIEADIGGNALIVQCDMVQVVHGTMDEDGPPATLVVFQFAFVRRGNNRRFKQVEITITFSAGELYGISPLKTWPIFRSEVEKELTHAVSPSIDAAFGPGKATLGYTWQLKKTTKIEGHARVEGMIRALAQRGRKRKNTAFWGLYENEQTKSSIPSFMQTAVLLKREKSDQDLVGEKFSAEILIEGEVDRYTYIKDKWQSIGKKMSGWNKKGEDVIFNTKSSRGSTVKNANNMRAEDLDTYLQLMDPLNRTDKIAAAAKQESKGPPDEKALEQKSAPPAQKEQAPETAHKEPPSQSPEKLVSESVAVPATLAAAVIGTSITEPAKSGESGPRPSNSNIQSLGLSTLLPNTTTLTPVDPTSTIPDEGQPPASKLGKPETATTAGEDVAQRLAELRDQLSKVRIEASLVRHLIRLEEEERRLLQEIIQLEYPGLNKLNNY